MEDRYGEMARQVRVVALCLIQESDRLLVAEDHDTATGETFYLPIGGHVEFGEMSPDTIHREVREELNTEVSDLQFLGTIENAFTWEGQMGHEIVLLYKGRLVTGSTIPNGHQVVEHTEDRGWTFPVRWVPIAVFRQGLATLYPSGALDLMSGLAGPVVRNQVMGHGFEPYRQDEG